MSMSGHWVTAYCLRSISLMNHQGTFTGNQLSSSPRVYFRKRTGPDLDLKRNISSKLKDNLPRLLMSPLELIICVYNLDG